MQCSVCSQLNNKPRVYIVVTYCRLHHTCSIIILWLHSLSGVIRSLLCNPCAFSPGIMIISVCVNTPTLFMSTCTSYVPTHIYIADMRTKEVSKLLNEAFLVKITNSNVMYNHVFSTLASSSTINNNSHNITIIHRKNTTKNTTAAMA